MEAPDPRFGSKWPPPLLDLKFLIYTARPNDAEEVSEAKARRDSEKY